MYFRVIPVLTLIGKGIYRTQRFKSPSYVGDPINAVSIFNRKEVDELMLMDISGEVELSDDRIKYLSDISSQAFMPMAYGGGIRTFQQIQKVLRAGFEKVILNTSLFENPNLVKNAVDHFGSQAIVASIDIKKSFFSGESIFYRCGKKRVSKNIIDVLNEIQGLGVGEIIIRSIDADGMMNGYDLNLISAVKNKVKVPLVALGGAGTINDFASARKAGADAVAAGSFFVYQGRQRAVLIQYPSQDQIQEIIK